MFASLPVLESHVDQLITDGAFNDALVNIMVGVHNYNKQAEQARKFLYFPHFDQQLEQLSKALLCSNSDVAERPLRHNTLIVATEMYQVGGHSRVIADVAREVSSPTIVLTDIFWTLRKTPDYVNWILDTLPDATVIVLPQLTFWKKCQALHQLTQRLQPRDIFYFNHHEDPIPFVGTIGHLGSRKTLIHHCDHSPSLGNTLCGMRHADFTEEMSKTCSGHLSRDAVVLPLYVADGGVKTFPPIKSHHFSVVTSGTHIKFARVGEMALQNIVRTVLSNVGGQFFHIGPIDGDWINEIKAYLESIHIDSNRFVALGPVASVWGTLAGLDAHLYLGSAPVGGGRAAIEAQGCGYPVAYFKVADQGPAIGANSIYASAELGWANLSELASVLQAVGAEHTRWSAQARLCYKQKYSHSEFVRVLNAITGHGAPGLNGPGEPTHSHGPHWQTG
jgi:hypothetical protein